VRAGIEADGLLADAWFGNKATIRTAEESLLTGILCMKKDRAKYRHTEFRQGQAIARGMDLKHSG
jgi:hypothetical protein